MLGPIENQGSASMPHECSDFFYQNTGFWHQYWFPLETNENLECLIALILFSARKWNRYVCTLWIVIGLNRWIIKPWVRLNRFSKSCDGRVICPLLLVFLVTLVANQVIRGELGWVLVDVDTPKLTLTNQTTRHGKSCLGSTSRNAFGQSETLRISQHQDKFNDCGSDLTDKYPNLLLGQCHRFWKKIEFGTLECIYANRCSPYTSIPCEYTQEMLSGIIKLLRKEKKL